MTYALLVAVLLGALLVYERHQEQRRMREMVALIDRLCQRIQAPAAAVLEHDEATRVMRDEEYAPPAVPPDDDDEFWASREKLAELAMQQELNDGR